MYFVFIVNSWCVAAHFGILGFWKGWQIDECLSMYKHNKHNYHMESALYGIYALVFVSEISLIHCAHSFDFWYVITPT